MRAFRVASGAWMVWSTYSFWCPGSVSPYIGAPFVRGARFPGNRGLRRGQGAIHAARDKVVNDYVMFELFSCDEKQGSTEQIHDKAALSFKFRKAALCNMTSSRFKAEISQTVALEAQYATQNTKTIFLGQTIQHG